MRRRPTRFGVGSRWAGAGSRSTAPKLRFASQSTGKSIAPFKVSVTRSDHSLTANLRDFRVEEELYLVHRTAVLDLLLHTSFTGTCPEFLEESWDDPQVPVPYEHRIGQGQILYLTPGPLLRTL